MATEMTRCGVDSNTLDFFDPDQVGGIATKVLPSELIAQDGIAQEYDSF